MESVNVTSARANLFKLVKIAIDSSEPINITSKDGDVVMLSKEDFESMQETLYLLSNKGLVKDAVSMKSAPDEDFVERDDLPW